MFNYFQLFKVKAVRANVKFEKEDTKTFLINTISIIYFL